MPLTREQLADAAAEILFEEPAKRGFARGVLGVLCQAVGDELLAAIDSFIEDCRALAQPGDSEALKRTLQERAGRRELIGAILAYVRNH
jgi:hypothetical protein